MEDVGDRRPDQQELDSLLDWLLAFAQQTLRRYGEFYPFGAVLDRAGEIVGQAATIEGDHRPPSQPLIDMLHGGMRSLAIAGDIKASGLCFDVRVQREGRPKTDAICVQLEHESGLAVACYQPYGKRGLRRGFEFRALFAEGLDPQVFARE